MPLKYSVSASSSISFFWKVITISQCIDFIKVFVTHDDDIASHTSRIIRLLDGKVLSNDHVEDPERVDASIAGRFNIASFLSAVPRAPAVSDEVVGGGRT